MRRILITLIYIIGFAHFSIAQEIDKETAQKVAQNFMSINNPSSSTTIENTYDIEEDGEVLIFVVNFSQGGWVMVSGAESTIPILGFAFEGYLDETSKASDSFNYLQSRYTDQLKKAKDISIINADIKDSWDQLLNQENTLRLKSYTPSTRLLNTSRGEVKWGQTKNNSGTCSPSYNKYCPTGAVEDDACDDKKPTGCSAVAMGQVMWYWQFPNTSTRNIYDWDLMPNILTYSTSENEGNEVAKLLRDCGIFSNTNYSSITIELIVTEIKKDFSWATTSNTKDALKDYLGYEGVTLVARSQYSYGNAWNDLIKSEIDCERPLIIRGDKADINGMKHHFVCDGYYAYDYDYFHFNWGWSGSCNGYYYFDDLTPGDDDYNENQQAIIGISPTSGSIFPDISSVTYTTVNDFKSLEAQSTISLPSTGSSLTVVSGGDYNLFAGDEIILKPGFKVASGGSFKAKNSSYEINDCGDISIVTINGLNGLTYTVNNANSYDFMLTSTNGSALFQSAGTFNNGVATVWDGTGVAAGYYIADISLRNNCGEKLNNTMTIFWSGLKSASIEFVDEDSSNFEAPIFENEESNKFIIYPNPNNGEFTINTGVDNWNISVYDTNGNEIYSQENLSSFIADINLGELFPGMYYVRISSEGESFTKKMIIK